MAMLTKMPFSKRIKTTVRWIGHLVNQGFKPVRYGGRFVVLTPPVFITQIILDKSKWKLITLKIRDFVDIYVIMDVFGQESYNLSKLTRYSDLSRLYESYLVNGQRPLIVDCGANSGMSVRYFSETYPHAHIVAVEPDPENLKIAKLNAGEEGIEYMLAGVGGADARADLHDPGQGNWAYRVEPKSDGAVKIVTINTILRELKVQGAVPFLIKIDIEGFESDLFENNVEWIDQFPLIIIELHDWMLPGQANSRNFLKHISQRDRDFVFTGENVFSISNTHLRTTKLEVTAEP